MSIHSLNFSMDDVVRVIDGLFSSGWTSFFDINIALHKLHRSILSSTTKHLTADEAIVMSINPDVLSEDDYIRRIMNSTINYTDRIKQYYYRMSEVWTKVHQGVQNRNCIDLIVEKKTINRSTSGSYPLRRSTELYLTKKGVKTLKVYRYIDRNYSILHDLEFYNEHYNRSDTEIEYDGLNTDEYGVVNDPEVIELKTRALKLKKKQEQLVEDTNRAISDRLNNINDLRKQKPVGWIDETSQKYFIAIAAGKGTLEDISLVPLFHDYGCHLMDTKDYSRGISVLEEGLAALGEAKMADDNKAKEKYALITQNLAALHTFTGNCTIAEKEALDSLAIFRALSESNDDYSYGVATLLFTLASIHVEMGKYDTVEEEYDEAASIFSRLSDEKPTQYLYWWVECITSLAGYYYLIRKINDSIEAYERAMPFLDKLTEKNFDDFAPQKVNAMINYSLALQNSGASQKAEDILHESIQLIHVLNEKCPNVYNEELSTALQDLGALYAETGEFVRAREVLLKAEGLRRELVAADPNAYNGRLAATLDSLANLDQFAGDSNEAIYKWKEALLLLEAYDNDGNSNFSSDKGQYCFCIGLTFLNLGDKDNALTFLRKAESLFRTVFDRNSAPQMFEDKYAMALSFLGVLYESMEEKEDEAEIKYEESLDIALWFNSCAHTLDHSFLIFVYCNYAPFLFNRGRYEEAKQMWEQAVKFGDAEEGPSIL